MSKYLSVEIWLHGLVGAFIGGGAGAVSSGFGAVMVDPSHFNLAAGLGHTLKLMLVVALVNGVVTMAAYLKQSPVPPLETTKTVETVSAVAVEGQPNVVKASTTVTTEKSSN